MNESFMTLAMIHLWQISILFLAIVLVSYIPMAKRRPHLMLLLWVLFFVKCLVPPVVQSPVSLMSALTPTQVQTSQQSIEQWLVSDTSVPATHDAARTQQPIQTIPSVEEPTSVALNLSDWGKVVWLFGSAVVLLTFAANYLWVQRRIFRSVLNADESPAVRRVKTTLAELQQQIGIPDRKVNVAVSKQSLGPLVFGFVKPTIVLPSEMLESEIQLRPIVAHELCHVWRRDHLLGFLQIAAQVLFWFHPFVWLASKRVNRLCEVCCDDDAMRIFDLNSKTYASGLLDVLSMQRVVRPVSLAPGIRPVEVTKQRIKMIVDNRHPKTRQSQMIISCIFLCLVIPALGSGAAQVTKVPEDLNPGSEKTFRAALTAAEVAQRRTEMDFLLGHWNVTDMNGQRAGESTFAYEKSGKMIREEWIAPGGVSAQGITFYDPNEQCWKMTWVDSAGVIMESSGQWNGQSLTLAGMITSKDGNKRGAQITISKIDADSMSSEMHVAFEGKMTKVSSTTYRRANTASAEE